MFNVSGWLYDQTGYYPASFFLGGAISLLGVPLIIPVCRSVINKWDGETIHLPENKT